MSFDGSKVLLTTFISFFVCGIHMTEIVSVALHFVA